jgi:hypothetical protein
VTIALAAAGLAVAAPAASADTTGCPQLLDRYPTIGYPFEASVESKPYCPFIGYAIDYGSAEEIIGRNVASDFDTRAANAGYAFEERRYADWAGTTWKSTSGGVYNVTVLYYIPPFLDDQGIGYWCKYPASVSGSTGSGHYTYSVGSVTCGTYWI